MGLSATKGFKGFRVSLPIAALIGTWFLVALIHLASTHEVRLRIWPLSYMALEILAFVSLGIRAWKSEGRLRRAWGLLALSTFLEIPSLWLTFAQLNGNPGAWAGRLVNLLSFATGALVLAGILYFPRGAERRGTGRRAVLESLIFAVSLLFLLWMMGVYGSLRAADHGVGPRVFVAYLNAALLGGSIVFMASYHPKRLFGPLGWLGASALAWLGALSCWTLAGLPSVVATKPWILLAGGIPLFQGIAAWSQQSIEDGITLDSDRGFVVLLPYIPMTLAVVVMGALLAWFPSKVTRGAFAIFFVVVVLLLLRMFQAIKDLQSSRKHLEERVTERTNSLEKAQKTLIKTERLNSVATMGAGLTHDLNNLLSVIQTSTELIHEQIEGGDAPSDRDLLRILKASAQAGQLTQRLMEFGRNTPGVAPRHLTGIREALISSQEILRMLLPRSIHLNFKIDELADPIQIDSAVLEQLLVNLVGNAKDAMPGGGRISIWLHSGAMRGGESAAVVEVQDNGPGIPLDIQEVMFDSFFTTKPAGLGTGLGLASVRALMDAMNGAIEVESQVGVGTTFRLFIPQGAS